MKKRNSGMFIAMSIGFLVINFALFNTHFIRLEDGAKGFFVGIGIAVIASPLVFAKIRNNKC